MKIFAAYLEAKNKKLEEELQVLKDRIESRVINVKVEKHGDVFYLFDKKNDFFIAQGKNFEEVAHHVDSRFKGNKVVFANDEELKASGLK